MLSFYSRLPSSRISLGAAVSSGLELQCWRVPNHSAWDIRGRASGDRPRHRSENDRPVWRPKRARFSLAQRLWSVSADKEQREKNAANLARKMHNHGTPLRPRRDDTSACLCSAKAEQCWQGSVSSVPGSITLLIPAATNLVTTPPLLDRCTRPRAYSTFSLHIERASSPLHAQPTRDWNRHCSYDFTHDIQR